MVLSPGVVTGPIGEHVLVHTHQVHQHEWPQLVLTTVSRERWQRDSSHLTDMKSPIQGD